MENMELYNKFRNVPNEAKKTIAGGRLKGMTDINAMWRIKVLTEEFGPCGIGWYYKPVKKWIEQVGNEYAAFVDIELYVKVNSEWSMPIYGTGGSRLATMEKSGVYVSDECYKMATTDAISVACKQLGIGADVYFESDRTKYDAQAGTENTENRKLNEEEKRYLQQASERTGMNIEAAIMKQGGKSIDDVTLKAYRTWMITLALAESKIPKIEDNKVEIPDGIEEELPFK